jgi:hypothetical protein
VILCSVPGLPLLVVILWAIFTHNRAAANRMHHFTAPHNASQVQQTKFLSVDITFIFNR